MGRRAGYGIGRSRRQRLRNKEHIQLQERALVHDGTYYDPSVDEEGSVRRGGGPRGESDFDLGSLAGSPDGGRKGNRERH